MSSLKSKAKIVAAMGLVLVSAMGVYGAAWAHHSANYLYDTQKTVSISGTITEVQLVNPHAMIYMDVSDASGSVTRWTVEAAGKLALSRMGWASKTVRPGDHVVMVGNPTHSGKPRMFFSSMKLDDGRSFVVQREAATNAIEEQRRQRAAERATSAPQQP
jgi:hypothetical protein